MDFFTHFICSRWVDNNFKAHEEFVGVHLLTLTSTENIFLTLKDVLLCLGLDIAKSMGNFL